MRIYGLGLCKNEDDVVGDAIEHALRFCDKVIVLDNGSTDRSFEVVQELERAHPGRVVAFGPVDEPFFDGMRSLVWDAFAAELGPDGWWYYLDADEFLEGDPIPVLERAAAGGFDSVKAWIVQFRFTELDLAEWERGGGAPPPGQVVSVRDRLRHYRTDWREYRFLANRPVAPWQDRGSYLPRRELNPTRERVFVRHYQYRDPVQMQKRIDTRVTQSEFFDHVTRASWRDYVTSPRGTVVHVEGRPFRLHPWNLYKHRLLALRDRALGRHVKA